MGNGVSSIEASERVQGWRCMLCSAKVADAFQPEIVTGQIQAVRPHDKELVILHFNDVYNIEPRDVEPVGGAARFVFKVKSFARENPIILFSGDAFAPSLMSTVTQGKQLVPVLKAIGVHYACIGNHDLDFGVEVMDDLIAQTGFPWMAANVVLKATGKTLGGFEKSYLVDWHGVKVGLMGLVEAEWIVTLATLQADQVIYTDFVEEGHILAQQLRDQGADIVIAMTHMRVPNDERLAAEVPEIDMILGGHDHHYEVLENTPHGTYVFKSGTDFREMTYIKCKLVPGGKPKVTWERIQINSEVPQDKEVAAVVESYQKQVGDSMEEVVGFTAVELDARFCEVRTKETNVGNFVCDVWRECVGCDVVILNSGTLRSDQIHAAGPLKNKDLVALCPMLDETIVMDMDAASLIAALENGVSQYPRLEGRFPQLSGVEFAFDPARPSGSRIIESTIRVGRKPIDMKARYKVATKDYLAKGKDGYDVFPLQPVATPSTLCPMITQMIRNHLVKLKNLNEHMEKGTPLSAEHSAYKECVDTIEDDGHSSYTALYDRNKNKYVIAPRADGRIRIGAE